MKPSSLSITKSSKLCPNTIDDRSAILPIPCIVIIRDMFLLWEDENTGKSEIASIILISVNNNSVNVVCFS